MAPGHPQQPKKAPCPLGTFLSGPLASGRKDVQYKAQLAFIKRLVTDLKHRS